jgi:ribosomal protein S18 acetylase RimI-like enzyme
MPPRQPAKPEDAGVRRASPSDAADVARLMDDFQVEFEEPSPGVSTLTERYGALLESGGVAVLLAGDGPDGFAQLRFRPSVITGARDAYLEELYVAPSSRRRGLGRALLDRAIATARREGATHMDIAVDEGDEPAVNLYQSLGFTNRESGPGGGLMFFYEREL